MRAPILFEDYEADLKKGGMRRRKVFVSILDDTYSKDKKHKPSDIRKNTVVYGCDIEIDDNEPFENYVWTIRTLFRDQMHEEKEKFKDRVVGNFSKKKKAKFRKLIENATYKSISTREHFKRLKEGGAKYLVVEDPERKILVRCEEIF